MAKVIKVPVLGQSVEEVRLLRWYKQVGDTVAVGEPLAEIETDKVNIDFESTEAGVVRKLLAEVDSFVKVEAPVAIVGTADEVIEEDGPSPSSSVLSNPPSLTPQPPLLQAKEGEFSHPPAQPNASIPQTSLIGMREGS